MSGAKQAGDRGEAAVAALLERRGYALLERQWRCRQGELDLVARDRDGTVCLVEVKTRSVHGVDAPARFDVAEVYVEEPSGRLRVEYLEDAFT